jgi:hypothetical protein
MDTAEKMFMCDKATVLNAIYDALDVISFVIDKSNSLRGTLIVSSTEFPQFGGRIAVSPGTAESKTLVEVFPSSNDAQQAEWIAALFDEMQVLIERAQRGVHK